MARLSSLMTAVVLWQVVTQTLVGAEPSQGMQSDSLPSYSYVISDDEVSQRVHYLIFDELPPDIDRLLPESSPIRQVMLLQPTPLLEPRFSLAPSIDRPINSGGATLVSRLENQPPVRQSFLRLSMLGNAAWGFDVVSGSESVSLSTTDLGNLLKKSNASTSTDTQQRNPIVNDTRVRSSQPGALSGSGSYWVPARADLDSPLNKIDSRLIEDVLILAGPYSSVYGPGHRFVDFQLIESPRSINGTDWNGRTAFEHHSNGNRWLGLQSLWGGGESWGLHASYAHRLGDNYRSGNGTATPSGYESRELLIATGIDVSESQSIELTLLRLDQTNVEFPGYVFDIDVLVTDGLKVAYYDESPAFSDRSEAELWYNRTWFEGNADSPFKKEQFPLLDRFSYSGTTDVDSTSAGYRRAHFWEGDIDQLILGHDLRFIKQELNELSTGALPGDPPIIQANSPVPRSFSVNPGLFMEFRRQWCCHWSMRCGGRLDYQQTDVVDDPVKLSELGFSENQRSLAEILGTAEFQTDRFLASVFTTLEHRFDEQWVGSCSVGYSERAPNLTELYAAEPFLLLVQNGLNTVTGDPRLSKEKQIQADVSLDYDTDHLRFGVRGFHAWVHDYITFRNTGAFPSSDPQDVEQVSLLYANTDLATLVGFESYIEFPYDALTPFGQLKYVDGRDRSVGGASGAEPLPSIAPLQSRTGLRWRDTGADAAWILEIAARIVDNQDRVATGLLETSSPGFTVWDLRGNYQPSFAKGLTLVAGMENLTDKLYREHLDSRAPNGTAIFQPGFSFYISVDRVY